MALKPDRTIGYGQNVALPELAQLPVVTVRNPTTRDRKPLGTIWVNRLTNNWWILTSVVANISTWTQAVNGGGIFATLEATQIGGILADTGPIVATLGNISATAGNIIANAGTVTAGAGLIATAGGLTVAGNVTITASDVNIDADATAHNINIGTGAAARVITVGNSTGNTSIVLNNGTGALNIGTNAIAHVVTLGNVTGATAVNINTGSAGSTITTANAVFTVATGTGTVTISGDATANTIDIATGAGVKGATLGSLFGASGTTIQAGTADLNLASTGDFISTITGAMTLDSASISLDATAASNFTVTGAATDLTLSASGGSVIIAADEAVVDAITLNSAAATGGIEINAGSGGIAITNTNGTFDITTGTGDITIGTDATDKSITIGSATVVSDVNLIAGTGNLNVTAPAIVLNGIHIMTGAGDPGAPLATEIGAFYIRTDAVSAVTRLFVATAVGTWTNVTCAA